VSPTSFSVAAHKAANAHKYRLFASLVLSDITYANLSKSRKGRKSAESTKPNLTIRGLTYSSATYYYRFASVDGPHFRVSNIYQITLQPAVPKGLALVKTAAGISLTWSNENATGFTIVQGTNRALTKNRRAYAVGPRTSQLTPYGLAKGTTYYFRIRAKNGKTSSPFSPTMVSAMATGHEQTVRMLTYNLLQSIWDGTKENGATVAPWDTQRKAGAAKLIARADPDVIAIQEGQGLVGPHKDQRQVDSLRAVLGSQYAVADTETATPKHRLGNYIIFRKTTYEAVANQGGHWSIGDDQFPAYQVLRNRTSGARFLVVSVHLHAGAQSWNTRHAAETRSLLRQAHDAAARFGGLPVVYGGDFNSHFAPKVGKLDAPGVEMQAQLVNDAINVAQSHSNEVYNSENGYVRVALKNGGCIDRIFAEPGVAIRTWAQMLTVKKGRYVGVIPSDHNPIVAGLSVPSP